MIAKASAISNGLPLLEYISGEAKIKKHPEKIYHVKNNLLDNFLDAMDIWDMMRIAAWGHPRNKNNTIRIEISPAIEYAKNYTLKDWSKLWDDFVEAFDSIVLLGKKGEIISGATNIKNSMSTVWLHKDSKSGIPHLHAMAARFDKYGNINDTLLISRRAMRAAEVVSKSREWTLAEDIHTHNNEKIEEDIKNILKSLDAWDWNQYLRRLKSYGYDYNVTKKKDGSIHGYTIKKGINKFKSVEIGKNFEYTFYQLENTWNDIKIKLGKENLSSCVEDTQRIAPIILNPEDEGFKIKEKEVKKENPSLDKDEKQNKQRSQAGSLPLKEESLERTKTSLQSDQSQGQKSSNYLKDGYKYHIKKKESIDINFDNKNYRFYIPSEVVDLFHKEFNSSTTRNSKELIDFSVALFIGLKSSVPPAQDNTGKDAFSFNEPKRENGEDDLLWARRCLRYAKEKLGVKKNFGMRR